MSNLVGEGGLSVEAVSGERPIHGGVDSDVEAYGRAGLGDPDVGAHADLGVIIPLRVEPDDVLSVGDGAARCVNLAERVEEHPRTLYARPAREGLIDGFVPRLYSDSVRCTV